MLDNLVSEFVAGSSESKHLISNILIFQRDDFVAGSSESKYPISDISLKFMAIDLNIKYSKFQYFREMNL